MSQARIVIGLGVALMIFPIACGDSGSSRSLPSSHGNAAPATTDDTSPSNASANALNEDTILAAVAQGAYHYSPQFTPVNHGAYTSAISPAKINVWVTSADFAAYSAIAPEKTGSGVKLAPGAMIVREVLGADGSPAKLTLMVKGPPGYNPDLGDFWFGVTEPNGTPLQENGAKLTGKLTQCFGCHIPRANDGYLFGVPLSARVAAIDAGTSAPPDAGAPPTAPRDVCGDFYCGSTESCVTCSVDCGACDDDGGAQGDDDNGGGGGGDNSGSGSGNSGSGSSGSGKGSSGSGKG